MCEIQQTTNIQLIKSFLKHIQLINNSYEKVAKVTGEYFNIFSVLKIETDEVRTHSRFIAELLNPKGSHSQETLFLELFLEQFKIDFELDSVEVKIEYPIGKISKDYLSGGRIDILIKNQKGQFVMIENKIYANDQHKQLTRYRNEYPDGELLYLTLWGTKSENEPVEEIKYQPISYSKDIIHWLEACQKETVNLPVLRETIGQYINLIKKITHQNLNQTMNKEIIDTILSSSENLTIWRELCDKSIQEGVKKNLVSSVANRIISYYTDSNEYKVIESMDTNKIDVSKGRSILIALQNKRLEDLGLCLRFNFEQTPYYHLIVGLYSEERDGEEKLGSSFYKNIPDAKKSELYPAYIVFEEYKDWWTGTLNKIYFDFDTFIKTADEKIKMFLDALGE